MKQIIRKIIPFMLALGLLAASAAFTGAETADSGVFPAIAGEKGTTYVDLFEVIITDAYCSTVHDVTLTGGKVTAHYTELSGEGMYGGIAGACLGSLITGCDAQADITIPDGTANAGIVGGGLQMTSVVNCKATGSVTAGNNCYGIGGISGCGFASEEFTDLIAEDIVITVGDDCSWIGGITGYAGGYPVEELGMPVTVFTNCAAIGVTVTTGENTEGVGDIVGSGFYSDELAANGAPFDQPTVYEIVE